MGMRLGMALLAGTLGIGLAGAAIAQDTSTKLDHGGLQFKTGDAFSFKMSTNMQIRAQLTDNRNTVEGSDSGDQMAFYVRRLKTAFTGNVIDKDWNYRFVYAWAGNTLEEAAVTYKGVEGLDIGIGRRKSFHSLQEITSSSAQQFVDRSDAHEAFRHKWATGAWVHGSTKFDAHTLRYHFMISNGVPSGDGNAQSNDLATGSGGAFPRGGGAAGSSGFNMMYNARVDLVGNGSDVTSGESDLRKKDNNGQLQFIAGMAAAWMQLDQHQTANLGGTGPYAADVYSLTWDTRVHVSGLSLNAAIFHRTVNYSDDADGDAAHANGYTDIGWYAQVGYAMHMDNGAIFEPAIRMSQIDRDDDNGGGPQFDANELAVAFNYYIKGNHRAKLTFDATYRELRAHGANADPDRPTAIYRLQLQLSF